MADRGTRAPRNGSVNIGVRSGGGSVEMAEKVYGRVVPSSCPSK